MNEYGSIETDRDRLQNRLHSWRGLTGSVFEAIERRFSDDLKL